MLVYKVQHLPLLLVSVRRQEADKLAPVLSHAGHCELEIHLIHTMINVAIVPVCNLKIETAIHKPCIRPSRMRKPSLSFLVDRKWILTLFSEKERVRATCSKGREGKSTKAFCITLGDAAFLPLWKRMCKVDHAEELILHSICHIYYCLAGITMIARAMKTSSHASESASLFMSSSICSGVRRSMAK